jgi:hypothetical protein
LAEHISPCSKIQQRLLRPAPEVRTKADSPLPVAAGRKFAAILVTIGARG